MNALASLAPLALALATPTTGLEVPLRFGPEPGTAFKKTFSSETSMEGGALQVVMDGQEIPGEYLPDLQITIAAQGEIAFVDTYRAVEEGRPTDLVRTFVTIEDEVESSTSMVSMDMPEVDEGGAASGDSELEGQSVRFQWDADEEAYEASYHECEGDATLLDGLVEDADLRALLPEDEVRVGATWTVDGSVFSALLAPGGDLGLVYTGYDADAQNTKPDEVRIEGEVELKLTGEHDHDGVPLASIGISGEIVVTQVLPGDLSNIPVADGVATETRTYRHTIEGELAWNLASNCLSSLEIESEIEAEVEIVKDASEPGPTFESTVTLEGEATFRVSVERAE